MSNYDTAKKIMGLLRFEERDPIILRALKDVCIQCEKYGPAPGKRCASLKMARENGWTDFVPPIWCRDEEGQVEP